MVYIGRLNVLELMGWLLWLCVSVVFVIVIYKVFCKVGDGVCYEVKDNVNIVSMKMVEVV